MTWQQDYAPLGGSVGWSALVAALPVLVLFLMLGVKRTAAWIAATTALAAAFVIALVVYGMPAGLAVLSAMYGAAFGIFPIAWIVFSSILLYRLAVDTGAFEVIKDSVGGLTSDRRLQVLLIAFAFGAFVEGAAGFGAPVAVSGAMLVGLGFSPFQAAGLCLLANTAPVAFGSLAIPVTTLATVTGLPVMALSQMTGRLCALISLFLPGYLIVVMTGWRRALEVLPVIVVAGASFAGTQFFVSNYIGPELTDVSSALVAIVAMVVIIRAGGAGRAGKAGPAGGAGRAISAREILWAWTPYILLVIFVLVWGQDAFKKWIDGLTTMLIPVPGLHNVIVRVPPVTGAASPYAATFVLNWLSAAGTACFLACVASALLLRVRPAQFARIYGATFKQLALPMLTIASMLALAYLMNYSGMTSTVGLALASTGWTFPFFSAVLGWLGVFLTGSDTASNALFGNLQVVTANALGLNPVLTASVNSAAGVMGKMIALPSIAVAVAATGLTTADESRLFRFTVTHSILLALVMGLVAMAYAYVVPGWVPSQ